MRTFKQPAETFSPYDLGAPRVRPDTSTPSRMAAVRIEDDIRRDRLETGVFIGADGAVLLRRQGLPDRVAYTQEELAGVRGATFTHNHPGGSGPSMDDVLIGAFAKLKELRVVTPQVRYLVTGLDQVWEGAVSLAYEEEMPVATAQVRELVRLGQVHPAYAKAEILHLTWVRVAKQLVFQYSLEVS